ncbi:hypothetical protein MNBD_ACTINO01-852 [hydrothermal vent metagenome]|uniref:Uncharacterized protein n=1 Tax=hydrothermal vent metagenome TaxID=652676 RepID=A0A3B0SF88_9ZZZZ
MDRDGWLVAPAATNFVFESGGGRCVLHTSCIDRKGLEGENGSLIHTVTRHLLKVPV